MGTIMIGNKVYENINDIEIENNFIYTNAMKLDLRDKDDTETVVQLSSVGKTSVGYLKTQYDAVVEGIVESICSYGNVCLQGSCDRVYVENCRFYNSTGSEYYKKARMDCKKRSKYGKRVIIKIFGEFNSILVRDCKYPVEVFIKGKVNKLNCIDLYCKGNIISGRCSSNMYVSRFASR